MKDVFPLKIANRNLLFVSFILSIFISFFISTASRASETIKAMSTPNPSLKEGFSQTVHGMNGITCSDCHTSQKGGTGQQRDMSAVCVRCHEEVWNIYKNSLHGKMGATKCTDCHNPHKIRSYKERKADERIAVCSRCHEDYLNKHRWLPNTALHFAYLECATCHSPRSQKSITYYFTQKKPSGKEPLSYKELVAFNGGSDPLQDATALKASPDRAIGRLFSTLAKHNPDLSIDASIIVTQAYHDYSEKHPVERRCVTCHSRKAAFYKSMFFILPGKDGADYIPVKGTLLSDYPILTSSDLYILGEEKLKKEDIDSVLASKRLSGLGLKWIDLLGLTFIFLPLAGVVIHSVLRMAVKR